MKESQLHQAFMAWLDKLQVPYRHDRTDKRTVTTVGEPDFLICWMSHCLFIEFKVGKNQLSAEQEKRIAYLRRSGNKVVVARSLEEAIEACHNILCINDAQRGFDADYRENFAKMKETVSKSGGTIEMLVDNANEVTGAAHIPTESKTFIGEFKGVPWVFEGSGAPGSETRMLRPANALDLQEAKR